jgi:hypothetical protein
VRVDRDADEPRRDRTSDARWRKDTRPTGWIETTYRCTNCNNEGASE